MDLMTTALCQSRLQPVSKLQTQVCALQARRKTLVQVLNSELVLGESVVG